MYTGIHTFPKDTSPKAKGIARLEFELTYFEGAILHLSHYSMGTRSAPFWD